MQSRKIDDLNLEVQQLQQQLQDKQQQLESRDIDVVEAGSIAEAAMRLNGVFEAAQAACDQYIENVKRRAEEQNMNYPKPVPIPVPTPVKTETDATFFSVFKKYLTSRLKK